MPGTVLSIEHIFCLHSAAVICGISVLIFINVKLRYRKVTCPRSCKIWHQGFKHKHLPPELVLLTSILTLKIVDLMKGKDD